MRRRLLAGILFVSFLLCTATCALIAWSHFRVITGFWGGWYVADAAPTMAGHLIMQDRRGSLQIGRGAVTWSGRRQQGEMPEAAGRELAAGDPIVRPRFLVGPLGGGNQYGATPNSNLLEQLGFYTESSPGRTPTTVYTTVIFPLWAVALLFAIAPGASSLPAPAASAAAGPAAVPPAATTSAQRRTGVPSAA